MEYSVNYKKEFSSRKHTVEATVQYQDNLESQYSDFLEQSTVFVGNPIADLIQRAENDEVQKQWLFQFDFNKPVGKDGNIELGTRSSFRMINNHYLVEQLEDGTFQNLTNLSNDFNYDENVFAAYGIYGNKKGKVSYQVGMRTEYSDILTELLQTREVNDRDYFNFFPSAFLNYEFTPGNTIQASYSNRIRRPRFWDLNPFFTFADSRNIFRGNPNLDPEFTDSYELNYIRYLDDMTITGGFFYRYTTNKIQRILTFNPDGTTLRQPENLATGNDYGLEFTLQYSGVKWLRLDGNANYYRQQVNGQNIDDNFNASSSVFTSRFTSRFDFWDSNLQLRLGYRGPRDTVQGRSKSITSVDIGWSKDILDKKATLTLSIRDLFNSRIRRGETIGEGFYREDEWQWRVRSYNLAFNYRINQKKQRQRQRGGGEDFEGGGEF